MKNKKYLIYVNNKPIEVSKSIYTEYWKNIEHERYLTKKIRRTWIYLDHLFNEYERNTLEINLIEDLNPTKSLVDKKIQIELLLNEIEKLPIDEQELINALYYKEMTQQEYARQLNITQQSISKKHKIIIEKLRKMLK